MPLCASGVVKTGELAVVVLTKRAEEHGPLKLGWGIAYADVYGVSNIYFAKPAHKRLVTFIVSNTH